MKILMDHHVAQEQHMHLPDWFIRHVLGHPKTGPEAVKQASYSAHDVEQDRESMDPRALLIRCLPYVRESRQGRGDKLLETDIDAFLRAPEKSHV